MDLCEGIYDVTSFALNRAYKDVVKPLADIYNKASDIMDKIPTPVKIVAGLVGGAIAIGTGIAPAIVAGTMIKAAVSGAVISGAMYGVSSLFTGNFDKKEFVNSMLHGAADMFMVSGVTLGVKGVVDCVTRNSGRIREAMLANEEGSTNAVDKLDDFYESRVRGTTNYGKSSENVVKGESKTLLPGEGDIGIYKDLIKTGKRGDNITPHHMPSAEYMSKKGIARNDGLCMNMEMPVPGSGGRHRLTDTYGGNMTEAEKAFYYSLSPRDALAYDIKNLRKIYQSDGLYDEISPQLIQYIKTAKTINPELFEK